MYLSFFFFLRVGEIAVSNGNYDNLLTISRVQFRPILNCLHLVDIALDHNEYIQ